MFALVRKSVDDMATRLEGSLLADNRCSACILKQQRITKEFERQMQWHRRLWRWVTRGESPSFELVHCYHEVKPLAGLEAWIPFPSEDLASIFGAKKTDQ